MNITVDNADTYFASRTIRKQWLEYSPEQRKAAIEQAKRDLSRALGRPMKEDEPQFKYGDQTRDEYAVYEQAVYTLLRDALPNGNTGVETPSLEPDEKQNTGHTLRSGRGKWSEEALAWLGASGRVEVMLG